VDLTRLTTAAALVGSFGDLEICNPILDTGASTEDHIDRRIRRKVADVSLCILEVIKGVGHNKSRGWSFEGVGFHLRCTTVGCEEVMRSTSKNKENLLYQLHSTKDAYLLHLN
jgi:hypothetical protein